jgi:hypothetical protein
MNLFVLSEITTKPHSLKYKCTPMSGSKSVRSLIQPNLVVNWCERSLKMPLVRLNYALQQIVSPHYLSCEYFSLDSNILDMRSYLYAGLIQDKCKNLQDDTILCSIDKVRKSEISSRSNPTNLVRVGKASA